MNLSNKMFSFKIIALDNNFLRVVAAVCVLMFYNKSNSTMQEYCVFVVHLILVIYFLKGKKIKFTCQKATVH